MKKYKWSLSHFEISKLDGKWWIAYPNNVEASEHAFQTWQEAIDHVNWELGRRGGFRDE